MRVRAFGGSRYGERVRMGEWPELDTAFLEDEYALQTGLRSYGVGVLQPAPFLILRERQTVGDRSYAFTLLLDPGRDVWLRFAWNGALILLSLLEDRELASSLVRSPESAGEGPLARAISSLAPARETPSGPAAHGPATPFELALVSAPLAASELLLTARQLGLESRPTLGETAATLDGLPPCFRAGLGWLVGGRPGSGWTYGCSLIVDDVDQTATPSPEQRHALETAESVLDGCRALAHEPILAPSVKAWLETPLAEWSAPPGNVLRQITVLARCLDGGSTGSGVDASLVDAASEAAAIEGPFSAEIRVAMVRLASGAEGSLSPPLTRFLVETELVSPGVLEPALARRLDPMSVAAELARRDLDLQAEGSRFPALSADQAIGVWQAQIWIAAPSPDEPAPIRLFRRSLVSLSTRLATREALHDAGRLLARAAVERTVALSVPLWRWLELRDDADVWPLLEDELKASARRKLSSASRDSHLSYLALADDPRGDWLAATRPTDVPAVAEAALQEIRDAGTVRAEASRWLLEAARSKVRTLLPVAKQKRIADALEGRWSRFRALWSLCQGEAPTRLPGGTVAGAETEMLLAELPEVLAAAAQAPMGVRLGDLDVSALSRIVGAKLNRKVLEQAARGQRRGERPVIPPQDDDPPNGEVAIFDLAPERLEDALSRLSPDARRRVVASGAAAAPQDFEALASRMLARAFGRRPTLEPFPSSARAVFEHLILESDAGDAVLRRVTRQVFGSEAAGVVETLRALLAERQPSSGLRPGGRPPGEQDHPGLPPGGRLPGEQEHPGLRPGGRPPDSQDHPGRLPALLQGTRTSLRRLASRWKRGDG